MVTDLPFFGGENQGSTKSMDLAEPFRIAQVLRHVHGFPLDIGCGYNNLIRRYGRGVGVDIHPWEGVDVLVDDCSRLPFRDNTFDTVTMIASLNHITNRREVLREVRRVLKDDGHLIVTMIGPIVGYFAHIVFGKDEKSRGGMVDGECKGMTHGHVTKLMRSTGFEIVLHKTFELGMNRLYIVSKSGQEVDAGENT